MRAARSYALSLALPFVCAAMTACGSAVEPAPDVSADMPADFSRALSSAPALYVLDRVEQQRGEMVVTFDHTCQGSRYTHRLTDSVTLHADGTAGRVFHIVRQKDGMPLDDSRVELTGRWEAFTQRNYYYFSDGPSISLTMALPGRSPQAAYQMRVFGASALATRSALGGSCVGSPNDAREAEFSYSRR